MVEPILICAGVYLASYPLNLASKGLNFDKRESVKIQTQDEDFYKIQASKKKYGVIVADTPKRRLKENFANAAELAYHAYASLGFEKDNIFFLEGQKLPTNRFKANNLPCGKERFNEVIEYLSRKITSEDTFFLSVFTHGLPSINIPFAPTGQSKLVLSKGEIVEKEMEERLGSLKPQYSVLFFNSCFGGGFAKRLGKERNVAISLSHQNKVACAGMPYYLEKAHGENGSAFTLAFYSALRGQFPDGTSLNLPSRDLESIFDYASRFEKKEPEGALTPLDEKLLAKYDAEQAELIRQKIIKLSSKIPVGRNTPHLVYGKINPSELIL
jgi:hypothetical protein